MDKIQDYTIKVVLTLRSPVLSAASIASLIGIDASPLRKKVGDQEFPLLPGSLIRGNLRHSWSKLAALSKNSGWMSQETIAYWLGAESDKESNNPARAKLRISDEWVAESSLVSGQTRFRISLDEETGKVKHGHLQQIEIPYPVGKEVDYTGWFECSSTEETAKSLCRYIDQGLTFLPSLGAFKGVGFGVLTKVKVYPQQVIPRRHEIAKCSGDLLGLSLEFDRPLSFNQVMSQPGNQFESSDFIPGAAIKAVIANRIGQLAGSSRWKKLSAYLDKICFSHGTAVLRDGSAHRSVPVPINLYTCKKEERIQADLVSPNAPFPVGENVAFQLDWKASQWSAINKFFIADYAQLPEYQMRIRTAIKEGSNTADEGRLFSSEVIETDQHKWLVNISLCNVPPLVRDKVRNELSEVLSCGLNGIGKIDACTIDIQMKENKWPHTIAESPVEGGLVSILLVSDARLFFDENLELKGTNDHNTLKSLYKKSWVSLSSGLLELDSFYASQKLVGGEYYRRRFKQMGKPYNPWLVTCAGSIFYFRTADVTAAALLLREWSDVGLPVLPKSSGAPGLSDDWGENPMVPANGYGEVLINPVVDVRGIGEALNND